MSQASRVQGLTFLRNNTICVMAAFGTNSDRRYFFTTGHGEHRGRSLKELRNWTPISTALPHDVVPRPGCEDGIVDSVEKYIFVYFENDEQITVEDALREIGASTEFPE